MTCVPPYLNTLAILCISTMVPGCTSIPARNGDKTVSGSSGFVLLPAPHEMSKQSFVGVDPYLENRRIVLLGEGMHMTREFPLARVALAQRLFEKHGFDMLLFEGSAIEAWLASDRVLNSKSLGNEDLARARDIAFPAIWRAPEYNRVFEKPFYVASYDLQPGMGALRADAVPEFLKAVRAYAPAPRTFDHWVEILGSLSDRKSGFPNSPLDWRTREQLLQIIAEYELWLPKAVVAVERKHPNSPHAAMLRLTPAFLRAQVELWNAHQSDPELRTFKTFQETRDRIGASMIERISREVSKSGKIAVWAHHVHVFHNTQGLARHSLGADLKRWEKDSVYTIGTFADTGEVYSLADGDDVVEGPLRATKDYGLESKLNEIEPSRDFFVDFKTLSQQDQHRTWLNEPTNARQEGGGRTQIIPVRDFDAAIFIQTVSKPKLPWSK